MVGDVPDCWGATYRLVHTDRTDSGVRESRSVELLYGCASLSEAHGGHGTIRTVTPLNVHDECSTPETGHRRVQKPLTTCNPCPSAQERITLAREHRNAQVSTGEHRYAQACIGYTA
jgi:hypothetical protein